MKYTLIVKQSWLHIAFVFSMCTLGSASAQSSFEANNLLSISAGYGTQGLAFGADIRLVELDLNNSYTGAIKGYLSLNSMKRQFERSTFIFNSVSYASDVRLTNLGVGLSVDIKYSRFCINPFVGLKYYYVRFTDQQLVDAIGLGGLIRYHYDNYGYLSQVGPQVDNGYGDAIAVDAGLWLGVNLTTVIEIGGLVGASPVTFSTAQSLFGTYWGESPYPNDYYVQVKTLRAELRLRLNF